MKKLSKKSMKTDTLAVPEFRTLLYRGNSSQNFQKNNDSKLSCGLPIDYAIASRWCREQFCRLSCRGIIRAVARSRVSWRCFEFAVGRRLAPEATHLKAVLQVKLIPTGILDSRCSEADPRPIKVAISSWRANTEQVSTKREGFRGSWKFYGSTPARPSRGVTNSRLYNGHGFEFQFPKTD